MVGIRGALHPGLTFKNSVTYSFQELFEYSDGGQAILSFLGEFTSNPIIVLSPGLKATSGSCYTQYFVSQAQKRGFDVVVVNHRGLYGCKLSSPKLYSVNSVIDIKEPVEQIKKRFLGRKVFAVGCSMGANRLACYLGEGAEVDGAVCV